MGAQSKSAVSLSEERPIYESRETSARAACINLREPIGFRGKAAELLIHADAALDLEQESDHEGLEPETEVEEAYDELGAGRDYASPMPSALKAYVSAAQKFKLLTKEEEANLAFRVQAGDHAAKQEMIERNLRLVIKAARRYSSSSLELLDLIEEGNLGLIRAIEKFDPSRGCRLSTYAMLWIKQSMERALMLNSTSMVKLPVHVTKEIYRYKKGVNQLAKHLGRTPTREETLSSLNLCGEKMDRMDRLNEYPKAVWNSEDEEEGSALGRQRDSFKNNPVFDNQTRILKDKVYQAFKSLTLRQKEILVRRFGLLGHIPQTLDDVGRSVNLTRERVRQIQTQALELLKTELNSLGIGLQDLDLESLSDY